MNRLLAVITGLGFFLMSLILGCGDGGGKAGVRPRSKSSHASKSAARNMPQEMSAAAPVADRMDDGSLRKQFQFGNPDVRFINPTRNYDAQPNFRTEGYASITENPYRLTAREPLSTFGIDVDTASYANVRRFLNQGQLPPAGAVRIEELINYFSYDYPQPEWDLPFSVNAEVAGCPWHEGHRLVRIGLKGREIEVDDRPAGNLVFLLDVSGSMRAGNKLPLVKAAMRLLVERLNSHDRIALVVYAGASGLALPSTPADQRETILSALDNLQAGGSTNGAEGIELAYQVARENFVPGGINRVILCTDGDFNVGATSDSELVRQIEDKAKTGVFLSVLGFGMGNYQDSKMQLLADKGNGNHAYIDSLGEARKVLVEEMAGTLLTIAKDVKIQVDFNPAHVAAYRLIGYENRMLKAEDFRDDTKDAGEIGAGHTVTALYEIIPPGQEIPLAEVDPSKYRLTETDPQEDLTTRENLGNEILTVRLRYKHPDAKESQEIRATVSAGYVLPFAEASEDFRFASSVALFGMQLRDSKYTGEGNLEKVVAMAEGSLKDDPKGYRLEFLQLAQASLALKQQSTRSAASRSPLSGR